MFSRFVFTWKIDWRRVGPAEYSNTFPELFHKAEGDQSCDFSASITRIGRHFSHISYLGYHMAYWRAGRQQHYPRIHREHTGYFTATIWFTCFYSGDVSDKNHGTSDQRSKKEVMLYFELFPRRSTAYQWSRLGSGSGGVQKATKVGNTPIRHRNYAPIPLL